MAKVTGGKAAWRAGLTAAIITLALPGGAGPVQAQGRPATAPTPADYSRAVGEIERLVRVRYVDAGREPAVLAILAEGRRSGRYAVATPEDFAARVTADLQKASDDGHMYINWKPEQHAALRTRPAAADDGGDDFWVERSRRENAGLTAMRILPGNVRYLKLDAFLWDPPTSPAAYDGAMVFLKGGDAAIIDLRGNGGGSPEAVNNYLTSHFVPASTLLMTFVMEGGEEKSVARDDLPAGRLTGKPVYVLIDKGVASAGEEFALHVDKFGFGELVGETTAGAGNRNELFPVAPGFVLSVSLGLAKHGTDGGGWQGVGVKPDVATPPEGALEVAHLRALDTLSAEGPARYRPQYAWAAEGVRGRVQPAAIRPEELGRYAGAFGERTVRVEGGRLIYQRASGPALKLTPLGRDLFAVGEGDAVRVRFDVRDGRASAVVVRYPDGRESRFVRTG